MAAPGMRWAFVVVIPRHTTTAVTINELESRLARDIESWLLRLAPADERSHPSVSTRGVRYLHNDIDARPEAEEEAERCRENGWDIEDPEVLQRWRDQEPINAHSHLLSMILGSSESIPVVEGKMVIGQWQSVLLLDLDGPRTRTVGVQLTGFR
uniref:Secondary thiamine-phosphate synthase enzyme n=1 Tax=Corethron hystrix TaxID=216773 RepID=A0A7S1BIQ1_9STRA